jgi:predicted dehydrogenase
MGAQRIYLIGAGIIARSHAKAAYHLPLEGQELSLAAADPNARALEEFAVQFPQARTFSDTRAMLEERAQDTDIVVVATPPVTHHRLTIEALATGRHVLCEKPLAMSREEGREMLAAARGWQRLLGCCSVRYFEWPPAKEARRLIQEGALGQLYHIRFQYLEQRNRPGIEYQPETLWFLDQAKSGGGTLMDRAPYEFSILNDLFQPVRVDVLSAWLANPTTALHLPPGTINDVEQHAGATLRYHFADGNTCMLTYERASCIHNEERASIEVEGLQGTLRWPWPKRDAPLALTHSYDVNGTLESKTVSFTQPGLANIGYKPLHYFYQRVLGQPSRAVVNEQAVFNFSCVRAIYDCARSGQPQTVILEPAASARESPL